MECGQDAANDQSTGITPSHEELQERVARISDLDPLLASHDRFLSDFSTPREPAGCTIDDQPIVHQNASGSDFASHVSRTSEDRTIPQQSVLRLLDTTSASQSSQPPSVVEYGRRDPRAPWLPFYLRRTTSLMFLAVFALMAAALEILYAISLRQSGLSAGTSSMRYLWSYGTTGTLTLVAAFWHRLDYETKVTAPWLKADPIISSKDALLVDYVDGWSVLVPFRAFKNQDYQVACSSTVSLLLQFVIVLSTALFMVTSTKTTNDAEPIILTSRFVDDPTRLEDSNSMLPYYIAMRTSLPNALADTNASSDPQPAYTEGYTDYFAYETFNPVSPDLIEVTAIVRGVRMDLSCETASIDNKVAMPKFQYLPNGNLFLDEGGPYFGIHYQGCQTSIEWPGFIAQHSREKLYLRNNNTSRAYGISLSGIHGFARDHCHSTDKDSHRLVFLSGEVEWRVDGRSIINDDGEQRIVVSIDAKVSRGAALACTPILNQIFLDVSRNNGRVQKVSPLGGQNANFLKAIHPWDLIDFMSGNSLFMESFAETRKVGNTTFMGDGLSRSILGFCGQSCQTPSELLNGTFLQHILAPFLSSYVAATAQVLLKEITNSPSVGTSSSTRVRLWVQPIVCQAMVGLLAIVIFFVLLMNLESSKSLTRKINPGSIAATMVLAGNVTSSKFPKILGKESTDELIRWVNGFQPTQESTSESPSISSSSRKGITRSRKRTKITNWAIMSRNLGFPDPVPLRPVSRITLVLTIAGCSITLASLLRKSTDDQGLGEGAGSEYRLYIWTTIPAFILTVASWWLSSIDLQIRILAPYNSLRCKRLGTEFLQLNLLRGLIPSVLYWEVKTTNFAAITTTIAALLGATLTTASAALFHVVIYPVSRPIAISPETVFTTIPAESVMWGSDPDSAALTSSLVSGPVSSLILEANLSYSKQVYQDLVLPTFSVTPHEMENASNTTNLSATTISLTVPALRPQLSCRIYSHDHITAIYIPDFAIPGLVNRVSGIVVNITTEECMHQLGLNGTAFFETEDHSECLFGTATSGEQGKIMFDSCSEYLYIWGYHNSTPGRVTNISALACNSSVELVYTSLSLLQVDMSLDLSNAPKPIEATARRIQEYDSYVDPYGSRVYDYLASLAMSNKTLFDSFFRQLLTSRYAIPSFTIGDPSQSQVVIDAIKFQHGIVHAQYLSANYRMDINSRNITENITGILRPNVFFNATSGKPAEFPAVLTYPSEKHRVVQDTTATAVLEALLLSILILSILGWWLYPTISALPRSPTNVASVLALLAGGNLLEHIYDGSSDLLCWEDLESRLGKDSRFYLGWGPSTSDEDSQRRFGIWMVKNQDRECSL